MGANKVGMFGLLAVGNLPYGRLGSSILPGWKRTSFSGGCGKKMVARDRKIRRERIFMSVANPKGEAQGGAE